MITIYNKTLCPFCYGTGIAKVLGIGRTQLCKICGGRGWMFVGKVHDK